MSQACGSILSYEIRQGSSNITTLNVSSAEPAKKLICDEVQCHLATPVELSILVSVSASNGHGATRPSYLKRLGPGTYFNDDDDVNLFLKQNKLKV